MYNFQVRNNLFYILYEATNLKTAGVCMARSQNSGQDDFKVMLKVQCSYFIIELFFMNWIKTSNFNEVFLEHLYSFSKVKQQYHRSHSNLKNTDIYKASFKTTNLFCPPSQPVEIHSRICSVPSYFLSFPLPLYFKEN